MVEALIGASVIGLSLGLFGSGGSILTVPILMYLLHIPATIAIATSLAIVAGISLGGSVFNVVRKQISYQHVLLFGLPGMAGTYFGAWLGTLVGSRWQLAVFVVLMALAAVLMWQGRKEQGDVKPIPIPTTLLQGALVGVVTGFVGVGGGFLIVPALMLLAGLPLLLATGTSLMIIAMNSIAGFAKYYQAYGVNNGVFDWHLIALMVAGGVVGSLLGSVISARLPKQLMQKGFAVFLVGMSGFVFVRSVM